MKKKSIVFIVIFLIGAGIGFAINSGMFMSEDQKDAKLKKEQIAHIKKTKFSKLKTVTMDELDKKIKNGDDVVAYFGWVYECGDSRLFEANSVDKFLTDKKVTDKMVVVNLDKEAPDALVKTELRKPITKRFMIDTWTKDESLNPMTLKSPQIIHYKGGKIVDLVSWTVLNSDSKNGMREEFTTAFFDKLIK